MNPKIKELIEQATEQVSQPEGTYGLISDYVFKFNKEKFAELIIRDVLSSVWDEVQYSTSQILANEIDGILKELYGIE